MKRFQSVRPPGARTHTPKSLRYNIEHSVELSRFLPGRSVRHDIIHRRPDLADTHGYIYTRHISIYIGAKQQQRPIGLVRLLARIDSRRSGFQHATKSFDRHRRLSRNQPGLSIAIKSAGKANGDKFLFSPSPL